MVPVLLALALLLQTPAVPPRDVSVQSEQPNGKCVLRGRVLDALSGQPIKGATVTLYSQRQQEPHSTSTDAEGRWEIVGLQPGEYHASVSKGGYTNRGVNPGRSIGLTESRPEQTVDLKLVRGAVMSGRVTDTDGEPIVGVQVMALRELPTDRGRQWGVASGGATTDDRGDFRVFGLEAGEYVLAAQPEEHHAPRKVQGNRMTPVLTYYPGTSALDQAQRFSLGDAAEYSDLTFALQVLPSIAVRGRVVASMDRIATGFGALIAVGEQSELTMGTSRTTTLGPGGSFTIQGVNAGVYRLSVRVELVNGEQEVGQLDVTAGDQDISGLVMTTNGATTLTGRVVTEPTSARRPEMLAVSAQPIGNRINMASYQQATVKPDGTFELKVYHSPLKLYLSVPLEGWFQSGVRWKSHDVRGGLNFDLGYPVEGVEIVLRRATSRITGAVSGVLREGKDDDEGAVLVFHQSDENLQGIGMAGSVPIRDGRFTFGPMAAGDYQVVAVRRFDPSIFGKPDVAELLRARATDVSVGDNETKTVNLTLIADY